MSLSKFREGDLVRRNRGTMSHLGHKGQTAIVTNHRNLGLVDIRLLSLHDDQTKSEVTVHETTIDKIG